MTTKIINIENNKFINPKDFEGLSGAWILGEGVVFNTPAEAIEMAKRNNTNGNSINHIMKEVLYQGKTYYQYNPTMFVRLGVHNWDVI